MKTKMRTNLFLSLLISSAIFLVEAIAFFIGICRNNEIGYYITFLYCIILIIFNISTFSICNAPAKIFVKKKYRAWVSFFMILIFLCYYIGLLASGALPNKILGLAVAVLLIAALLLEFMGIKKMVIDEVITYKNNDEKNI